MTTSNNPNTDDPTEELPEICASRNPADGSPILIKRGERGFWPFTAKFTPEECNCVLGISKAQERAMVVGALRGWNTVGADPANYTRSETAPERFDRDKRLMERGKQ
jgi:hypothetical protein